MDDNQKMLRAIINGQTTLKQELVNKINQVDQKVDSLREELHTFRKDLTDRVDRLGKSLAYLEDDISTREEFDGLEERVDKLEHQPTSAL